MQKNAIISACGKYRYSLSRIWDETLPTVLFIGLNPSTADADNDDPTIHKLRRYCQQWGYGGFEIVNLFAFRSSKPEALIPLGNKAIGPNNPDYISAGLEKHSITVCMWGKNANLISSTVTTIWTQTLANKVGIKCFKLNQDGSPMHPRFLGHFIKPIPFVIK